MVKIKKSSYFEWLKKENTKEVREISKLLAYQSFFKSSFAFFLFSPLVIRNDSSTSTNLQKKKKPQARI